MASASQVNEQARSNMRQFLSLRLQGVVCGIDREHQSVLLKDDSGFVWLEALSLPEALQPGAIAVVEGTAAVGNRRVVFRPMPVADQNWVYGKIEQSGRIYLKSGRYPFEVHYLQTTGTNLLDVTCNGLGLSSNSFPADLFVCPSSAEPEALVGGLRYECFEGPQVQLPDFMPLTPSPGPAHSADDFSTALLASGAKLIGSGIASNISLLLAGRETNYLLRFHGYFQAPTNGFYQFSVAADDSARLMLPYDASSRIEVTGKNALPEARQTAPGQAWADGQDSFWAETEGLVKRVGSHEGRLVLELVSERAGHMEVTVADGTSVEPSILLNSRIAARGVCTSVLTPGSSRLAGDLFVPSAAEINFHHASEVLWLDYPVATVSNLANLPLTNRAGGIVHLQGVAAEIKEGQLKALEDATGRIQVRSLPQAAVEQGAAVDVIGLLTRQDGQFVLSSAVCRQNTTLANTKVLPTLTTIEQVRRLKPEQAALRYPVKIRGVVLFTFSGGTRADVQGESESIYLSGTSSARQALEVGKLYEFDGSANSGAFSPTITYRSATLLGNGNIPEPMHPNWNQLINGSLDAQWVEVEGVVLKVSGPDMVIGTRRGNVTAKFFHEDNSDLKPYLDAIVRVRGTVRAVANRQRQLQSVYIKVPSPLQVIVVQPPPTDPFSAPAKRVSELREFDPGAAFFQRVRTTGQVMHVRDGIGYLMDGTNGMRFVPRDNVKLSAGDRVELVGFPELEGPSPVLQQAQVRVLDRSSLPPAQTIPATNLLDAANDSTRVRFDANLLNVRTNQSELVLELQTGRHVFQARLDGKFGGLALTPVGSSLTLTGTYVGQGVSSVQDTKVQSFELLLNSPDDVAILERPSWWTPQRAFAIVGGMAFILALAAVWITLLRRQVEARTQALRDEVESHKHTEAELEVKTKTLEQEIIERAQIHSELEDKKTRLETEIEERKRVEREVEKTHRQLVDVSRKAGQAEVASSILHNVGNVLNSVNVSTSLLNDRIRKMRVTNVGKAASLMQANSENLGGWIVEDPKGRQLPSYLAGLGKQLEEEQEMILKEMTGLGQNVEHIKEIIAMQQSYARVAGVSETIPVPELVENALKMETAGLTRHGISLVRDFDEVPPITVDKHRVLQILVNLLHNAKYACEEYQQPDKRVDIRIKRAEDARIRIEVADNGVGIAEENLKRIFTHGFTTRKDGHGFGLHSAALAAKELGGALTVHSDGPGKGASFVLELPLESPKH